ncbi:MAG: hypothetical protein LBC43_01385 [Bifidobacteriaceae bacterium]|jgi:hypothetical protein|nr:hypothetical protein [Bifidobacteriaceae bacterium]
MPKIVRLHADSEQPLSQTYVRQNLETEQWGKLVHADKQRPHNELTSEPGKSYLLASVDAQELFNKYAGTGELQRDHRKRFINIELVQADFYVGIAVNEGKRKLTKRFKIHHPKNRTHIVPYSKPGSE